MSDSKRDLIIVSNRLPLSIKRVDGSYESSISSGGLVTSLSGLTKSTKFRWFGWPGIEVKDPQDQDQVSKSLVAHNAIPIFLDSGLAHEHYNGFSSTQPTTLATLTSSPTNLRPDPLANPPLPIGGNLRRRTVAGIPARERALRRRHRRRRNNGRPDLGSRLPPHAAPGTPTQQTAAAGQGVRDRVFAAHALSRGRLLAQPARAQAPDRGAVGERSDRVPHGRV